MNRVQRMWINQPSILQPEHDLHGTLALAEMDTCYPSRALIYFLDGDVESRFILKSALSKGWPRHLRAKRPADHTAGHPLESKP